MAGTWSLGRIWLKFPEGHPMHGLEVLMRRRLMREPDAEEFDFLTEEAIEALDYAERRAYIQALTEHRCREFARLLIKWNFSETTEVPGTDGEEREAPVPPTAEGVGLLDPDTFTALWLAYNQATTVVAPPLPKPSDDGGSSEVESTMPQEPLSTSPRTLDTL